MIVIFNTNGSIYDTELADYVQQGSNGANRLQVAYVDSTRSGLSAYLIAQRPNGTSVTLPAHKASFDCNGERYQGWEVTITGSFTLYAGVVHCTLNIVDEDDQIQANYPFDVTVNATGNPIDGEWDEQINVAQYNAFMAMLSGKATINRVDSKDELPIPGQRSVLWLVGTDKYDAYAWDPEAEEYRTILNGIYVVGDIAQADISGLPNGYIIYSNATASIYRKDTSTQAGYTKLYDIASKSWVADNYVPYTGATKDVDLGGFFIRHAKTENEYLNYKEGEDNISSVKFVLGNNFALTDAIDEFAYAYLERPNATLSYGGNLYRHVTDTQDDLIYACVNGAITPSADGTSLHLGLVIKISKTEVGGVHDHAMASLDLDLYSKAQAKDKFSTSIAIDLNNTTYKFVAKLYNANGELISTSNEIDFPLESIVSSATYYDEYTYDGVTYTKVIVITLSTTSVPTIVPVGDLVSGLEKEACVEITSASGTFTEEQMQTLALDNASVKFNGRIFHKVTDSYFNSVDVVSEQVQGQLVNLVISNNIQITPATRAYQWVTKSIQVYNKDEIDTIVQGLQDNIQANADDIDTLEGNVQELDEKKANKDGNYPTMSVGQADQLNSTISIEDKVPYLFRTSGGTADIGNRENDKIVGGTIVWNALARELTSDNYGTNNCSASFSDGVITMTASAYRGNLYSRYKTLPNVENHVVMICADVKATQVGAVRLYAYGGYMTKANTIANAWERICKFTKTSSAWGSDLTERNQFTFEDIRQSDWDAVQIKNIVPVDLTQMFGSTIADYIYSLEQNEAGSGVAWFKSLFPKDHYAYDGGTPLSVKLTSHDTVGFNQWDEEWELGIIDFQTGEEVESANRIRSKNFIPVLPNTTYYFNAPFSAVEESANYWRYCWYDKDKNYISGDSTKIIGLKTTPANAYYLKFNASVNYGTTYKHDICINLSWSGYRNGEYEPYEMNTYALDGNIELRGIPKLDGNDNLYFDGDEYHADGSVKRKKYVQKFTGSETGWEVASQPHTFRLNCNKFPVPPKNNILQNNTTHVYGTWHKLQDSEIGAMDGIYTAYTNAFYVTVMSCSTLSELQTYLASNPLIIGYDINETDETADPFQDPQIVNDFGTEEYVVPTQLTDVEMPVGHETLYPANLRDKLQRLPDMPDSDGYYVVRYTSRQCEFTPLSTWLANNGYKTEEAMKDTFGMKDALGGTLRQLLATKESLNFDNTAYVDLGILSWTIYDTNVYVCYPPNIASYSNDGVASPNIICSNYKTAARDNIASSNDEKAVGQKANYILFYSSTKNATQIQALMKGAILAYKKAS